MFERFTERSIKTIMFAQEETRRLAHAFVGSEMLLIALLREGGPHTAEAFQIAGLTLDNVRVEVEKVIGRGETETWIEIPFTAAELRKKVLESIDQKES